MNKTYKNPVIPGLVPGTHAPPPSLANMLKELTSGAEGLYLLNGVGGRDKPDHDGLASKEAR